MLRKVLVGGLYMAMLLAAATNDTSLSDPRLSNAAMQGDRDTVRSLLLRKVDVNAAQGDGSTALHWAAFRDDLEMAQLLIEAGANVKATTRLGDLTPIFMASKNGSAAMIELLLKAGADPNSTDSHGATPLMSAAAAGSTDAVKVLLDHGANVNAKETTWGQTALMFAASLNRAEAIRMLIAHGGDPKITAKVASLGDYKIPGDKDSVRENAPAAMGGMTALHYAAREGHMNSVRALVDGGADINELCAADNTSVLTEAIINGHYDMAKFLLDHGADAKSSNSDGLGPLYATIDMQWANRTWYPPANIGQEKENYLDLMSELLSHGANPNDKTQKGLWFRRIRDDWVDAAGATPFWRAAQANDLAAMKLLIAAGADPNIPTAHRSTALIVAAGYGFEDQLSAIVPDARMATVKYLVNELGANVNAKDEKGYTALHGAAYVGNDEVVLFLVAKGADVKARSIGFLGTEGPRVFDAKDHMGDTVADMANGPHEHGIQHPGTLALLVKLGSVNSNNCRSSTCIPVVNAPGFNDLISREDNASDKKDADAKETVKKETDQKEK
jgi:uncharacterized protein